MNAAGCSTPLRGQNSDSSKRDSVAFIYVDAAPPLPLYPYPLVSSFFFPCASSRRLNIFFCFSPVSVSSATREIVGRVFLDIAINFPRVIPFFPSPLFFFIFLFLSVARLFSLSLHLFKYSAKLAKVSVRFRPDMTAPLNHLNRDWGKWQADCD